MERQENLVNRCRAISIGDVAEATFERASGKFETVRGVVYGSALSFSKSKWIFGEKARVVQGVMVGTTRITNGSKPQEHLREIKLIEISHKDNDSTNKLDTQELIGIPLQFDPTQPRSTAPTGLGEEWDPLQQMIEDLISHRENFYKSFGLVVDITEDYQKRDSELASLKANLATIKLHRGEKHCMDDLYCKDFVCATCYQSNGLAAVFPCATREAIMDIFVSWKRERVHHD